MADDRLLYKFDTFAASDKKAGFSFRITTFTIVAKAGHNVKETGRCFSLRSPSLVSILFKYSVLTSNKEKQTDVTDISLFVTLRNPFAAFAEIEIKLTNLFCE
jgi:hypothetical protein